MNKLEISNRKRIGYAISVFILAFALLYFSLFFDFDFFFNPDIFFASMIFTEILLLSIFVFMITNPKSTKRTKYKIIAVFIFLMISVYFISAYLYTQPFICTHFTGVLTNHFYLRSLNSYSNLFVNYNGTYIPTKLYFYLYILKLPPFTTTIPNLNGTKLLVNFKVYSPPPLIFSYTIKVPYKIVEENITNWQNNFFFTNGGESAITSPKFYALKLEPLTSSTNITQIDINNLTNPLISHTGIVVSEVEYPNGQNFICQGIS